MRFKLLKTLLDFRLPSQYVGFDDRRLMLYAIPLMSLIVPVALLKCNFNLPWYTLWQVYQTLLITIFFAWLGARSILIGARIGYDKKKATPVRVLLQTVFLILLYAAATFEFVVFELDALNVTKAFAPSSYRPLSDILTGITGFGAFLFIVVSTGYQLQYASKRLENSLQALADASTEAAKQHIHLLVNQTYCDFLLNTITALRSHAVSQPLKAAAIIDQLLLVYNALPKFKLDICKPLGEELAILELYKNFLEIQFGNKIIVTVNIDDAKYNLCIVPLATVVVLENILSNTLLANGNTLMVEITTELHFGRYYLTIKHPLQMKGTACALDGGLKNLKIRNNYLNEMDIFILEDYETYSISVPLMD